jgi:hypothetical protein
MTQIKKITIENFRGIKLPLIIDLVKGGKSTSTILYGRNGTGKSSIVDAWEWLNNFAIQQLNREGVSCQDFPHKSSKGENCYISVEFDDPSIKFVKAQFNPRKISTPNVSGQYEELKSIAAYPNYLRYSDLQSFVYKTKAERYKFITKYFGLERFSALQDTIQASIGRLSTNLLGFQQTTNIAQEGIKRITKLETFDEKAVLNFLNTIAKKYGINDIKEIKNADEIKNQLAKIVNSNPVAKELSQWKSFQEKIRQFYPIGNPRSTCKSLEDDFFELKKNEESIKQLILSELYQNALEVLPKLENKEQCPLCDNDFDGDLLKHISEKREKLEALNKQKKDFESKKSTLESYFSVLHKKLLLVDSERNAQIRAILKPLFDDIAKLSPDINGIIDLLRKTLMVLDKLEISSSNALGVIEELINKQAENEKIITERISELSKDESTKTLAQDYSDIDQLIQFYKSYHVNSEKVNYLKSIVDDLSSFFTLLTDYIQETIQTTFSEIATDVVECFNILEGFNPYIKNPQIKLIADKDKAVELEIEFIDEIVTPAFKVLSESQVNSFGLSIFLAGVKSFNKDFKFFILDDVVNSFDSFKRPRVSQLISKKFPDFQALIMTHDQIFFDTIQRDFPEWQRYRFVSWDFATGPKYKLSQNYLEEVKGYIDDDKPLTAGQTLGRYLEWTLGILNENMQTPIRYKVENVFTLAEFYDPLISRFKSKLKQAGYTHRLLETFDQLDQGTIFRNYCVHWKSESAPFSTPEITTIFEKWIEIEKIIFCHDCKSYVKFDSQTGTEYIKCNCGKIDLKNPTNYT